MSATVDLSQAWANAQQNQATNNGNVYKTTWYINQKLSGGVLLGYGMDTTKNGVRTAKGANKRFFDLVMEQCASIPVNEMVEITIQGITFFVYHSDGSKEPSVEETEAWKVEFPSK